MQPRNPGWIDAPMKILEETKSNQSVEK